MTIDHQKWDIINIVIAGRGGMGVVTACEIIAEAAYLSGNFQDVHAYPSFGAERRGAPVQAYAKLSKTEKLWDRAQIKSPHILIVLDETVLRAELSDSMAKNGFIIINSNNEPDYFKNKFNLADSIHIIVADITKIALEQGLTIDGAPVVNTPILGLLSKTIEELSLENLAKVVKKRMTKNIAELNIKLIEEGFKFAKIL